MGTRHDSTPLNSLPREGRRKAGGEHLRRREAGGLPRCQICTASSLPPSIAGVCLSGVADEDGGRSKRLPLDTAAVLGRGQVMKSKAGCSLLGTHSWGT